LRRELNCPTSKLRNNVDGAAEDSAFTAFHASLGKNHRLLIPLDN
jgi:hypothetical protein